MKNYVAVDIGASSGRVIVGRQIENQLKLVEVHRFKNEFRHRDGSDRWNVGQLISEIISGLQKVKKSGISECVIGIDTWGVDYVRLNKNGERLSDPIAYRDSRTKDKMARIINKVGREKIYQKTGIQFLNFNTLYQLASEDINNLRITDQFLFMADYLAYAITGKKVAEKTNASTSQLLNLEMQEFDEELLKTVGIRREQFAPLVDAGTVIGPILPELIDKYNLSEGIVVATATHDTAAAVVGTPVEQTELDWAYLSSGTWSLIGQELSSFQNDSAAMTANYTNEWGAFKSYRFLKNIMGMWIVQEIARDQNYQYSFAEMAQLAAEVEGFKVFLDVNDESFLNPSSMIEAIQRYCLLSNQFVPQTTGELVRVIYDNLALSYANELGNLSHLTGQQIKDLYIVGGGSNVALLNQLTANLAQVSVHAGPSEATAVGNLAVLMISQQEVADIQAARKLIANSFEIKNFEPEPMSGQILSDYQMFLKEKEKEKE